MISKTTLWVYEDEMKRSSSSTSNSLNLAFLSSENTSSTNEVSTASGNFGVNTAGGTSLTNQVLSTSGADEVVCSFFADSFRRHEGTWISKENNLLPLTSHKLSATTITGKGTLLRNANQEGTKGKDLMVIIAGGMQQQMNHHSHSALVAQDGLGCYDRKQCILMNQLIMLKWPSPHKLIKSRILGHEKMNWPWGEKLEFQNYELKCREIKINNLKMELENVVKERDELKDKIEKLEESSKGLNKLLNSQMSAKDKNCLGYGTQLDEMSNKSETNNEISMSVFEVISSDEEITPANDRFSKADRYHTGIPHQSQGTT
ncbi:hypothetical protein Tco_1329818 [Tanacetum coccineum]|uniref:Uncharacterized protein n=1 Tax=Tanacetum coccineum TaxID=301880 RepID=A0ABQ4WFD9_9ASTR